MSDICPHVGICGGCSIAHPADPGILDTKRQLLADALERAGFPNADIAPMIAIPLGTRRRMDFAAARVGGAIRFGLHAPRSHNVIDLQTCLLADPRIESLIAPLRALFARLTGMRRKGGVILAITETGIDACFALDAPATAEDRARLIGCAEANDIARISLADEPVLIRRTPVLNSGALAITPPPGAFLQPSEAGEAAIRAAITQFLPKKIPRAARIIELYAGIGSLTGALAEHAKIHAVEGNNAAIAALDRAIRQAGIAGRITTETRDLARRPLSAKELASAAAIVLDPPFDGAGPQIAQIAASGVARVIYVSCNPQALSRDISHLRRAGYVVTGAVPIDQFPGSVHLEAVLGFRKNIR